LKSLTRLVQTGVVLALCAYGQAGLQPPVITKSFGAASIKVGDVTTVSFVVTNPSTDTDLSDVRFADTLPSGLNVTFPVNVTNGGCTGGSAATVSVGSTQISFSDPTLTPGANCHFTVSIIANTPGVKNNSVTVDAAGAAGAGRLTGNTALATITVLAPPGLTKVFTPPSIFVGETATLTFVVSNPNTAGITGVAFVDTLPAGLVVVGPLNTSCGFTLVATTGSNTISLSNGTIPAGGSCLTQITVASTGTIIGTLVNTTSTVSSTNAGVGAAATATLDVAAGESYQVRYAAHLDTADAVVTMTNTGFNGASLLGPGFGGPAGNICVNVYAFSPDEQLIGCCSCLVTPNGLSSFSVRQSLTAKTLTGVTPTSLVIKLLATATGLDPTTGLPTFSGSSCTNSAAVAGPLFPIVRSGLAAWGTSTHLTPTPGTLATTATRFTPATLSPGELASITGRCASIIGNGSGFGQCLGCNANGGGLPGIF
jgi:uncharacterized repeat protein (TIGR01451 family)/fimbrial isopeptide formation D2 family protein